MEAAKAAYAKYKQEMARLKAKKMQKFEKKYRREHPGVNGRGDAAKGAIALARRAHEMKLDETIKKRLYEAKRKLFDFVKKVEANSGTSSVTTEEADFIKSATFTGSRPGYFFARGDHGIGFYRDTGVVVQTDSVPSTKSQQRAVQAERYPYDPYAFFPEALSQYHRAMKGKNHEKIIVPFAMSFCVYYTGSRP